jgi:hypothetical protein
VSLKPAPLAAVGLPLDQADVVDDQYARLGLFPRDAQAGLAAIAHRSAQLDGLLQDAHAAVFDERNHRGVSLAQTGEHAAQRDRHFGGVGNPVRFGIDGESLAGSGRDRRFGTQSAGQDQGASEENRTKVFHRLG